LLLALCPAVGLMAGRWPDLELCRQELVFVFLSPRSFPLLAKRLDCDLLLVEDVIDCASPRRPSLST
jgi:hypothetical protein